MLSNRKLRRRSFLKHIAAGAGLLAMHGMQEYETEAGESDKAKLNTRQSHHPDRCIFINLVGGLSQYDLFYPKPKINELDGEDLPAELLKQFRFPGGKKFERSSVQIKGTPWKFEKHGNSGMDFSELLPHIANHADRLTMIRTMHTSEIVHAPAQTLFQTGFPRDGHPSIGSWLQYGWGNIHQDLPNFIVLWAGDTEYYSPSLWGSGFLPGKHAGVRLSPGEVPPTYRTPPGIPPEIQDHTFGGISDLNRIRRQQIAVPELDDRIAAYELAFRMQTSAPEVLEFRQEPKHILELYGIKDLADKKAFANHCLLARRFIERGVRFVNLYHSHWDHHGAIDDRLPKSCEQVDQPVAALLTDLAQRGLLESTLVVFGTEFGRTPFSEFQNQIVPKGAEFGPGRDHHGHAFTIWMAGAGLKPGFIYGETDELGWAPVENPVHIHDLQATLLHLFGFDHKQLTYRHAGRDFRLTDVGGSVVHDILI